ncbi:Eisosomes component [Teratosphaeriaceae sp. CCFEE 6253]|nr:Eisosomes component [Teratosphaeriaceae sp. CCFEE 6253]KAK3114397.1 Eisosomes component [Teratosphaeriaceae sp. CCFEE 6253]
MAISRAILSLAALLLLAGGIVMEILVILSGAHIGSPTNQVFFLQAATGGISSTSPNYQNPARWTYFSICGVGNGLNQNCGPIHAAQTFDPARNFGTSQGVPAPFVGTRKFYWLSRFAWAFYIVALFFAVMAFFLGFLALCTRLGAYLTGMMSTLALFFQTLTAALMTAWTVQARNAFRRNGSTASLGIKAFAFTWAAMGCYFLATILFCLGGAASKKDNHQQKSKTSYFGRKKSTRSTRSRGSFIDSESQRRVKDEYD